MMRRMLTPIRPLSDDWLYWDPEHMDDFPDSTTSDLTVHSNRVERRSKDKTRTRLRFGPGSGRTGFSSAPWTRIVLLGGVLVSLLLLCVPPSAAGQTEMPIPVVAGTPGEESEGEMSGPLVEIDQVGRGSLLFSTPHARLYRHAPVLSTDVQMDITWPISRVLVTQTFRNTGNQWLKVCMSSLCPKPPPWITFACKWVSGSSKGLLKSVARPSAFTRRPSSPVARRRSWSRSGQISLPTRWRISVPVKRYG